MIETLDRLANLLIRALTLIASVLLGARIRDGRFTRLSPPNGQISRPPSIRAASTPRA